MRQGYSRLSPTYPLKSSAQPRTGPDSVAAQWVMRGTDAGGLQGAPPTGKSVTLPGADFITTIGDKVASVKGYFDSVDVPRQLGMQVIVQPSAIGSIQFGYSVYFPTDNRAKPAPSA